VQQCAARRRLVAGAEGGFYCGETRNSCASSTSAAAPALISVNAISWFAYMVTL
jgi:hypothetical protein